ncbi:hypothetical protein E2320_009382 [Naja naja]|nr:hypothetical protein E2320_009382 [Naja naja]
MPPLGSPLLCAGPPEDPRWAKTAAWRESTGALRAWLGQHLQNPYPSKGEKVLLAVLSQRSLSQVSTWFANARRRLKKENWLHSGPRLLTASGEEERKRRRARRATLEASGQTQAGAPRSPGELQGCRCLARTQTRPRTPGLRQPGCPGEGPSRAPAVDCG